MTSSAGSAERDTDAARVPFVASLRVAPGIIRLGAEGEARISIRVEIPEVWDAVRVDAPLTATVFAVKTHALMALYPDHATPSAFVVKRRGVAIQDETATLAAAGVRNGSTLLVTLLRRRPVRS